jgi:hypothetical protein
MSMLLLCKLYSVYAVGDRCDVLPLLCTLLRALLGVQDGAYFPGARGFASHCMKPLCHCSYLAAQHCTSAPTHLSAAA